MHLSYCTNVHPAEDFDGIVRQFDTYAAAIRRHLDATHTAFEASRVP